MLLVPAARASDRRAAPVAPGFHGVAVQRPLDDDDVRLMRSAHVGAVRFLITWRGTEREPGVFDWRSADEYMQDISAAGAVPLPFVWKAPDWLPTDDTGDPMSTPEAQDAWGDFMRAVVERYGPEGTFVADHPEVTPVRTWQLWNEPNLGGFWGAEPSPESYARMAELGSAAVRSTDPDARVALAGLAPARRGLTPATFMRQFLWRLHSGTFDVAAIHPYGTSIGDVREQVADARDAMWEAGFGRKPLAVTEIGWGSQRNGIRILRGSDASQADMLRATYATFARHRRWRVSQVFWFAWKDLDANNDICSFCATSGLLTADGRRKPSLKAFRRSADRLRKQAR